MPISREMCEDLWGLMFCGFGYSHGRCERANTGKQHAIWKQTSYWGKVTFSIPKRVYISKSKEFCSVFQNVGNSYKFLLFCPNWMVQCLTLKSWYGLWEYYCYYYLPKKLFQIKKKTQTINQTTNKSDEYLVSLMQMICCIVLHIFNNFKKQ